MKLTSWIMLTLGVALIGSWAVGVLPARADEKVIEMATTTSTQASGLLDHLLPALEKETGIRVKVLAKGTGAALRDGMEGNVDVVFVHAPAREEDFVASGYGTRRYPVMHNDFVILGPADDPAGIQGMTDAPAALVKIAVRKSPFVSRGDDSGTHTKEQALWEKAGVPLQTRTSAIVKKGKTAEIKFVHPEGLAQWYFSIGQGMGKTLTFANEKEAYTLADRGTYLKYKYGGGAPFDLQVLCEGDPSLLNPYGVIPVNPEKFPHVNHQAAQAFVDWLTGPRGQKLIQDYRLLGQPLFHPDAIPNP